VEQANRNNKETFDCWEAFGIKGGIVEYRNLGNVRIELENRGGGKF